MPIPIVLDVDTGVDDALALILAARSPELDLRGVTCVAGNTTIEKATRNTLLVLDRVQVRADLPVAAGTSEPLARRLETAAEVHGTDGLGNVSALYPRSARALAPMGADELLLRTIHEQTGKLTLIATGPMTNLARALERDPTTFREVKEIVQMGGAVAVPGNTTRYAEFNLWVDPEAAAVVFASGIPLRFVPLDVTEKLILTRPRMRELAQERDSSVFQFVREFTVIYFDFHLQHLGINGGYLHDPAAVTSPIHPEWFTWRRARLRIETSDAERGRVRAQWDEPGAAQVATDVNVEKVVEFVVERVCR
ncbi:MAG: nucleoside hydrolase [Acidobacteria bacterium]|nr:nucleoside hydrolase [Acidobacteriota bacterium]